MSKKYIVSVSEYKRGKGCQNIIDHEFSNYESAVKFAADINDEVIKLNESEYYMRASFPKVKG